MPEIRQDIRSVTFVVAANDSLHKNMADYACDGTSDQVEINLALNALPASGGSVKLLEGTYTIDAPITIPGNNITLMGEGGSTFIDGDGLATTEHGIVISGMTGVSVKNLSIQTEDGGLKTCHCIFIEDGSHAFDIEGVIIIDSDSDGIHIEGTAIDGGIIHNCYILDTDDHGISVDGDAFVTHNRISIIDSLVSSSGLDGIIFGITAAAFTYCIIQGNTISGIALAGINVTNANLGLISDNIVEGCFQEGIHVDTSLSIKVEGNQVHGNTFYGMWLDESDYAVIADNLFNDNDALGNTYSGLYVTETEHAAITGNSCSINGLHGILLLRCNSCSVIGNTCADQNTGDGIHITGDGTEDADYNQISGNNCVGNGDDGIEIEGGANAVGNSITGNHVTLNGDHGINIAAPDTKISGNYVYCNSQDTPGTDHGINLAAGSDRCSVNDNNCTGDGASQEDGIHLGDGPSEIQIIGNYCYNGMGDGIELSANNDDCLIKDNYLSANDDFGIAISAATCNDNTVANNKFVANGGAINDAGTTTILPETTTKTPNPDGNIGDHPTQLMLDGVDTTVRMEIECPSEFQELVRAHIIIVSAAAGDLRRAVTTDWGRICLVEDYNAHSDAIAAGEVAVLANDLTCIDISAALNVVALTANDWIGVTFTREATNALDTIGDTVYVLGMRLQYV